MASTCDTSIQLLISYLPNKLILNKINPMLAYFIDQPCLNTIRNKTKTRKGYHQ